MILPPLLVKYARHQSKDSTCGPCSLRHAILCHGEIVSEERIVKLAGSTWDGTDADQLISAAEALGFRMHQYIVRSSGEAYEFLRAHLPAILEVDASQHWIVAVHATSRHVTFCDSSYYWQKPTPVIQRMTWRRALSRMAIWTPDRTEFHMLPVEVEG